MEKENKEYLKLNENEQKETEKEFIKLPILISKDEINKPSDINIENTNNKEIKVDNKIEDKNNINMLNKKRERESLEIVNEGENENEDEKTEKNKEKNNETKENEKSIDKKNNIEENKIIPLIEGADIKNDDDKNNLIQGTKTEEKTNDKKEEKKEEKIDDKKEEKKEERKEEKKDGKKEDKEEKKEDEIQKNNQEIRNSPNIQNNNNNVNNDNHTNPKKRVTFKEAQQSIKDFMVLLNETEKKIKEKYGNCLPDFSCEDQLPISWRTKLINKFFESEEMKNIVNKMKEEQKNK